MLIEEASLGSDGARADFAARYLDVVRAYLSSRWKGTPMHAELDDAVQEVFLECFRQGGVLERAADSQPDSFRAFLYGVTRNVAKRWEKSASRRRERQPVIDLESERIPSADATPSRVFDRAWAQALFRQAGELQRERARAAGDEATRRVELLELRSRDGLPIRAIAARWEMDAPRVHKEYARARQEFKAALLEVLSFHHPGLSRADLDARCLELIDLLKC